MIKLIAADMDGTLLNSQKELSKDLYPLIEELHEKGIKFAVASGRQYYNLVKNFETVKDKVTFICENGSIVFDQGKNIVSDEIPYEGLVELVNMVRQIDNAYVVLCGVESAYIENLDPEFMRNADMYYERCARVSDVLDAAKEDKICKVAIFDVADAEINSYAKLQSIAKEYKLVLSGHEWVDIMNLTANKGEGLRLIQETYQISYDETMAFGDYLNDYELMQECYYSYAMANAHPLLKEISRFEAPSNDEDGVVRTIKEYLKKE